MLTRVQVTDESGIIPAGADPQASGLPMRRIAAIAFLLTLACAEVVAAQTNRASADRRDRLEQTRERARFNHPAIKALDDCDQVPDETLDVLRYGFVIVHEDQLVAAGARNQAVINSIISGVSGELTQALDLPFRVPVAGFRPLRIEPYTREEFRPIMEREFRRWVVEGGRLRCTQRAEDVAWAYAPATGSECAGLPNELVDALRGSSNFYSQDRWEVRLQVLEDFRASTATDCTEFTSKLVGAARMLDP